MKALYFLILIFILNFFTACDNAESVWVSKEVFTCCNPWDEIENGNHLSRARLFLEINGVAVNDAIFIDNTPRVLCGVCCECPENDFVRFRINPFHVGLAGSLGFLEE